MRPFPNCFRAARLLPTLLAVGLAGAALAGEPNPIMHQRGGLAEAVVIAGQFAYIGQGGTVVTMRLSATQRPTVVDISLPLPGLVRGMAIYGKILFVSWDGAWSRDQLSLFSLTDPQKPERRGEFRYTAEDESEPRDLVVVGHTLYVADARLGLVPIDISDPLTPVAGPPVDWPIEALSVMGNGYLVTGYVFDWLPPSQFRLAVYDISNPLQPMRVGAFGEGSRSDLVSGSDFTVAFPNASRVWTFDDPASPLAVPFPGPTSQGMLVVRDRLLVPTSNTVRVWDLTDPFHPIPGSDVSLPVSLWIAKTTAISPTLDRALILDRKNWIVQLDTLDADAPNLQQFVRIPTPTIAGRLTPLGPNLLISEAGGFTLRNQKLELLERIDFGPVGIPIIMDLEGSLALLATFPPGLLVADFSDPGNPTLFGRLPLTQPKAGILQQNLAWVATGDPFEQNVLASVDLSDPAHPQVLHTSEITEGADLALEGSTLYLADHFGGLRIFGASGTAPVPLGQYSDCIDVRHVDVVGPIAAISCGYSQIHLVDVSDPTNPTQLGDYVFAVPFWANRGSSSILYTRETGTDRVFIGYPGTIDVVDIHDPANPVLSDRIEVAGWVGAMETTEGGFWAAAGAGGIVRVRLDDEGGAISQTFSANRR